MPSWGAPGESSGAVGASYGGLGALLRGLGLLLSRAWNYLRGGLGACGISEHSWDLLDVLGRSRGCLALLLRGLGLLISGGCLAASCVAPGPSRRALAVDLGRFWVHSGICLGIRNYMFCLPTLYFVAINVFCKHKDFINVLEAT